MEKDTDKIYRSVHSIRGDVVDLLKALDSIKAVIQAKKPEGETEMIISFDLRAALNKIEVIKKPIEDLLR